MSEIEPRKLVSAGSLYHDTNLKDPSYEGVVLPDSEVKISGEYVAEPGGSALNVVRFASALGMETHFIGSISANIFGDAIIRELESEGIVPAIVTHPGVQTNVNFNVIGKDGRKHYLTAGSANEALTPEDVEDQLKKIDDGRFFYLGGAFKLPKLLPAVNDLIDIAKARGMQVVFDHGRVPQSNNDPEKQKEVEILRAKIREIVEKVDMYFPSVKELSEVWEETDFDKLTHMIIDSTPAFIAIKNGEHGAIALQHGNEPFQMGAFKVDPINTVGAGDAFNAGFLKSLLTSRDVRRNMIYASATAALKISQRNLPTDDNVRDFIEGRLRDTINPFNRFGRPSNYK